MKVVLEIEFDDQDLLDGFVAWFYNSGEQGYHESMKMGLDETMVERFTYPGDDNRITMTSGPVWPEEA